jgi:hypothetical protein
MVGAIFGSNTRPSNIRQTEHAPSAAVNMTLCPRLTAAPKSSSSFGSMFRQLLARKRRQSGPVGCSGLVRQLVILAAQLFDLDPKVLPLDRVVPDQLQVTDAGSPVIDDLSGGAIERHGEQASCPG